jgi:Protein of unknown function with HXXEE motif
LNVAILISNEEIWVLMVRYASRIKRIFLLLILAQGLHSIEEYYGKLWNKLAPARFLSSLVSDDLKKGFVILNIGLFVAGLLCWWLAFQKNKRFIQGFIWPWIVIEIINGIGHPFWCLVEKSYVPGVITAPLLLIIAIYLLRELVLLEKQESLSI